MVSTDSKLDMAVIINFAAFIWYLFFISVNYIKRLSLLNNYNWPRPGNIIDDLQFLNINFIILMCFLFLNIYERIENTNELMKIIYYYKSRKIFLKYILQQKLFMQFPILKNIMCKRCIFWLIASPEQPASFFPFVCRLLFFFIVRWYCVSFLCFS